MPRVTVGLPFFDEARHLGAAIRSVLAQTFTDFELVLVDDGSHDDSLSVARSFRDPRITVLADGRRRRLPARLNEIVTHSNAAFVARMDADDVMHPTRLARQVALLDERPSCDVVGTWAVLIDAREEPFAVVESGPIPPTPRSALLHGIMPHATVMGRREWFAANPYNEALSRTEDRDLWCRTVSQSSFAVLETCLYVIRVDVEKQTFLASYRESHRQSREIFATYGPRFVGTHETQRLVLAAHAKSLVMTLLFRAGLADRLVSRRGRAPTDEERALAREALAAAAQRA